MTGRSSKQALVLEVGTWKKAASLILVMIASLAACTRDVPATDEYLDHVAAITMSMTRSSVAALPQGVTPTHLQVGAVVGLRAAARDDIASLSPTDEVRQEHVALVTALTGLVAAGRSFLDETDGLDQAGFVAALTSSTEIDALAATVHKACFEMEKRSIEVGHPVDLGC